MIDYYNVNKPRLTRGEYWLLETVVELTIHLKLLVNESLDEALNKESHGMDRELLIETLLELQSNGLIEMFKWDVDHERKEILKLNKTEIIQAFDKKQPFRNITDTQYQLTKFGGQVWEAFARPDWGCFMDEWFYDTNNSKEKGVVVCANERILITYFASRNNEYMIVDMEAVNWSTLKPFKATYWKTLPIGYKVDFEYTDIENGDKTIFPYRYIGRFHRPSPRWYDWK